jgi:branched-subunit amino acid aminotransferase/4-amino-4-deoxychorismate lyase
MELTRNGELNIEPRAFSLRNEQIEAITVEAPRWSPKVNGTKHGDWQPYLNAMNQADQAGTDLALLVHEYAIVDGDRATPMVFDEDSTVWVCGDTEGAVESITASILIPLLEDSGIPVQKGRLNERLVARALEMVAVGSGLGASQIESIDGDAIGKDHGFAIKCQTLLTQHYENKNAWSDVGA